MPHRKRKFEQLVRQAAACRFCPDMAGQAAVLGSANGSLDARVVFVAEAPGRLGAGRTGIPFSGDKSGENFELLLAHSGLTRGDVFITNAALCNPLKNGNNRRPATVEIRNCSKYLKSVLEIIRPELVVTLGAVGLTAVNALVQAKHKLDQTAACPIKMHDFILLPLYHPSPRVTSWKRPLARQKRDFKKILTILKSRQPASSNPA